MSIAGMELQQALGELEVAMRAGKPGTAMTAFKKALRLAPGDLQLMNRMGTFLIGTGHANEAVAVYDGAVQLEPKSPALHFNRGIALEEAGRFTDAAQALDEALALKPNYAEASARLAGLAVRRGDFVAARRHAEASLKITSLSAATLALAAADIADGAFVHAHDILRPVARDTALSQVNRSLAHTLIGDAFDGLDRPADAFAAYTTARQMLREMLASRFDRPGVETPRRRAERVAQYFENAGDAWRAPVAAATAGPTHVFLVGFPRSGTTLLEQALAGHPDIETLEEANCLYEVGQGFLASDTNLEKLESLTPQEADAPRAAYWKRVAAAGGKRDKSVFVDKMPLNATLLCVVARLFPNARILFAVRDPRDVVLSAFRRRLMMSEHMFELITPDRAAAYYDAVMRLVAAYRGALPLELLEVKHEAVLADFDGEIRKVCDFLGIPWNTGLADIAATAARNEIATPSAPQLARGLRTEGAGQWRRYREQLAPVLPVLAPWVRRFGYPDE